MALEPSSQGARFYQKKKSFTEEKDQNRMLTLSLRACGRQSWGLRGLETHTEMKRGNKCTAVIEIATTLFNWINNPCLKSREEGSLECLRSDLGISDPEHWTHWHRKGKLKSLNKQWKENQHRQINAAKVNRVQISRMQPGRFPDAGSELTCSSLAFRRHGAREFKVS